MDEEVFLVINFNLLYLEVLQEFERLKNSSTSRICLDKLPENIEKFYDLRWIIIKFEGARFREFNVLQVLRIWINRARNSGRLCQEMFQLLNWLKVFLGLYHHLLLSKGLKLKSTRFFKMWKKRDYWFKCGCKLCFVWALLENIPHCYQLLGCDWFNLGLWKISGNVLNLSKFGFWPRISGTCKNAGNYRCYYRSWNSQKYIKIERNF